MQGGALDTALVLVVLAFDLGTVLALFRILHLYPAPPFSRLSLRSEARRMLAPAGRGDRWKARLSESRRDWPFAELVPYFLVFAGLFLPTPLQLLGVDTGVLAFGPFKSVNDSKEFLQTLWQVVAAAVGLTVAMVAFSFEAFMGSGQRQFGGSLREYARETGVLVAVRLGVLALFLNGTVLLGLGEGAPAGWAAIWVTAVAALTLLEVLMIIESTIRSLAPAQLMQIRRRQLERVVDAALRRQLLSQAADLVLREGNGLPVQRSFMPIVGAHLRAEKVGNLRDIRLGALSRLAVQRSSVSSPAMIHTLVGLDQALGLDSDFAVVPQDFSLRDQRRARRAFRIEKSNDDAEEVDLVSQIDRLHGIAKTAIRSHQATEWREIGKLYELILLALPREASRVGLPFEGAIAAPGIFGLGPLQRIEHNLYQELEVALEVDDAELADAISYLPLAIAQRAARLGANAIVVSMLGLYPSMYARARGSEQ